MKNKLFIVCVLIIYSHFLLGACVSTKDQINSMRMIQHQIIDNHQKTCDTCQKRSKLEEFTHSLMQNVCTTYSEIITNFHRQLAEEVLKASDLTALEKLSNLPQEKYFEERKKIIKAMIEQGAHPNSIMWGYEQTPMSQAILFKDSEFQEFLRKHDAK